jgi:hypothetical protein
MTAAKPESGSLAPLLVGLATAIHTRALYPRPHPMVSGTAAEALKALDAALRERGSDEITLLVVDQDLVVDEHPLRGAALYPRTVVRALARRGVQRLTLAGGLELEELVRLLDGLAGTGALTGSAHVVLGRLALAGEAGSGAKEAGVDGERGDALSERQVDLAQEAYLRIGADPRGSVELLDRLVWELMEGLASSTRSLLLLGPLRDFDQRLFVHSINCSLLAMAQAGGLGIQGSPLHEIGLAALLHDVGKLGLPRALLHKVGRFNEREWEIVRLHPELGAAQLSGIPGVPALAVLVAYEHHLRWDAKPNYPPLARGRQPSFASQITAIADTYDDFVAARGGGSQPAEQAARAVWRERAGTYLDPFLVGDFVLMVAQEAVA